jgi:hypothetical protein
MFGFPVISPAGSTVTLPGLYALLVFGASVQERSPARLAFLGLVSFALAVASFALNPGSGDPGVIGASARASGSGFFAANAGLLLLGALLSIAAALATLRQRGRLPAGLALLAGAGAALWFAVGLVRQSGPGRSLLVATSVALVGATAGWLLQRLGRVGTAAEPSVRWPGLPGSVPAAIGFGLGALGVVAGPRVSGVFLGLAAAAAADFADRPPRGGGGFPWLLVVLLVLAPVWWLMSTIAGPVGLRIADLGDVPLSPRAEILLALPIGLVVWAGFGLWPAHRLFPGGLFAALGAVLWLRVASPSMASGLRHWQPILFPLGALGVWGGALRGRGALALSATAFLALASGAPGSGLTALLLIGAAAAVGWSSAPPGRAQAPIGRLGWASAALVLPFALEAGLSGQVTYTLAAAAGFAAAVWRGFGPVPDSGGPEPRVAGRGDA